MTGVRYPSTGYAFVGTVSIKTRSIASFCVQRNESQNCATLNDYIHAKGEKSCADGRWPFELFWIQYWTITYYTKITQFIQMQECLKHPIDLRLFERISVNLCYT